MKVGAILMAQNYGEYLRPDRGTVPHVGSSEFFREEIKAAELAVSLGFETIWSVEHHSTAHGESPAPLQQLTYFAGKTTANLGTSVVVLPWNDPVRVAEQIAVLDNLLEPGRTLTIGVGRGSAKVEFDQFEIDLGESNERFHENWDIVRKLLTEENVSYKGKWRSFENVTVLPRPKSKDIVDRVVYSWGSRTSLEYAASSGFLPLFVSQGDVTKQAEDMKVYNEIRGRHGWDPVRPIVSLNVFVDKDPDRAQEEGRKYLRNFYSATLDHYQRLEPEHFAKAGNYSETAEKAAAMAKRDRAELLDELAAVQPCGTPEQVLGQLREWYEVIDPSEFAFCVRFGGMPYAETERNIRAVSEILPEVRKWTSADDRSRTLTVGDRV
ncbi:MAG: LLM class flavin-dependent oxidoreductase [Hyphomicrobiales bacterium]|nr:MAG: LLM class flavin-dependent oxidoreductase [Hyphomicrobiales bacterium]